MRSKSRIKNFDIVGQSLAGTGSKLVAPRLRNELNFAALVTSKWELEGNRVGSRSESVDRVVPLSDGNVMSSDWSRGHVS